MRWLIDLLTAFFGEFLGFAKEAAQERREVDQVGDKESADAVDDFFLAGLDDADDAGVQDVPAEPDSSDS